jgi:flagellar protein FliO/FliZ
MRLGRLITLAVALSPTVAMAQAAAPTITNPPAPDFSGNVIQLVIGLAVVLAMIVGSLWILKQLTQRRGASTGLLKLVASTAVGPRERVVIVEVGSTWLVLGVAPGRVNALAEVPRQADVTVSPPNRRPASVYSPPTAVDPSPPSA